MKLWILRHAEREEIKNHKSNRLTPLTEKGKQDSFFLGNAMNLFLSEEQKIVISTSNMKRTIDTGKYIAKGFGMERVKKFVQDPKLCTWHLNYDIPFDELNHRVIHDYKNMVKDWHIGKYKKYLHSMKEITNMFEEIIIHELASDTQVLIIITHDVLISALSFQWGFKKYQNEAPRYLSGFFKDDFFSNINEWREFEFSKLINDLELSNIENKLRNLAYIKIN